MVADGTGGVNSKRRPTWTCSLGDCVNSVSFSTETVPETGTRRSHSVYITRPLSV